MRLSMSNLSCALVGIALLGATACAPQTTTEPFPAGTPQSPAADKVGAPESPGAPSPVAESPKAEAKADAKDAKADAKDAKADAKDAKADAKDAKADAKDAKADAKEVAGKDALSDVKKDSEEPVVPDIAPQTHSIILNDAGIEVASELKLGIPITFKVTNKRKAKASFKVEGVKGLEIKELAPGATQELVFKTPGPGPLSFSSDVGKMAKVDIKE